MGHFDEPSSPINWDMLDASHLTYPPFEDLQFDTDFDSWFNESVGPASTSPSRVLEADTETHSSPITKDPLVQLGSDDQLSRQSQRQTSHSLSREQQGFACSTSDVRSQVGGAIQGVGKAASQTFPAALSYAEYMAPEQAPYLGMVQVDETPSHPDYQFSHDYGFVASSVYPEEGIDNGLGEPSNLLVYGASETQDGPSQSCPQYGDLFSLHDLGSDPPDNQHAALPLPADGPSTRKRKYPMDGEEEATDNPSKATRALSVADAQNYEASGRVVRRFVKATFSKATEQGPDDWQLMTAHGEKAKGQFRGYFSSFEDARIKRERLVELHFKDRKDCTFLETDATFPRTIEEQKDYVRMIFDAITDWNDYQEWTQALDTETRERYIEKMIDKMITAGEIAADEEISISRLGNRNELQKILPSLERQQKKVLSRDLNDQTAEWLSWGLLVSGVLVWLRPVQ